MSNAAQWTTDILGENWVARTIPLGQDTEGPVAATLVRSAAGPRHARAVLYVHGFVDYFFQTHQAEFFEELGYDFYALDLRKYGRSLLPGQSPNYVTSLADYRHELDYAARLIAHEGHNSMMVMGHSTGGLITSLWVDARPNAAESLGIEISALLLNSPWFDLNESLFLRTAGTKIVSQVSKVAPRLKISSMAPYYGRALHASTGGEWDYNLEWKPFAGFPIRAAWFSAIRRGHSRIHQGLDIHCPVLVLTSDLSGSNHTDHPELLTTDSVLDVEQIWAEAPNLADDVTIVPIAGGSHDLALSPGTARTAYFDSIRSWLSKHQ